MGVQVELLTTNKTCHEKEFIDFEFDGKHISEFGWIAAISGDRLSINASPEFEDETSEVNGVSGQYYWGTRRKAGSLTFSLATDGVSEQDLNAFKIHFKPGKYGKFIKDELSHRYGYARVSAQTVFTVIPFKKKIIIRGREIEVNEYKGEATLTFVFDDPNFYATEQYLNVPATEDSLRAVFNNSAPFSDSWDKDYFCFIGNGALKDSEYVANAIYSGSNPLYFYNPSSVPTKTKIAMKFIPTFSIISSLYYFSEIADTINGKGDYNSIIMYDKDENVLSSFNYTTPNVIYSINRAIQLAADYYSSTTVWSVLELEEKLRLDITNSKVIGWAASVLRIMKMKNFYNTENDCFTDGVISVDLSMVGGTISNLNWLQYFNIFMLCMMAHCEPDNQGNYHLENANWSFEDYEICFDGINSQTTMNYQYNQISDALQNFSAQEENCGDMVCSNYLKLEGGDILNSLSNIATTHTLKFYQGNSTLNVKEATLEYTYCYS